MTVTTVLALLIVELYLGINVDQNNLIKNKYFCEQLLLFYVNCLLCIHILHTDAE